jgi:cytochrome c553
MTTVKRLTAIAALLLPLAAPAAGDPELGRMKSETCTACHGEDGKGILPIYPVLAGQYEDYIVWSLKQYRSGARNNAIMMPMAAALSDDDIADLAAFYASLPGLGNLKR